MKCDHHWHFQMRIYSVHLESAWENRSRKLEKEVNVFKSFRDLIHVKVESSIVNLVVTLLTSCPSFYPHCLCCKPCGLYQAPCTFPVCFSLPSSRVRNLMSKANATIPWNPEYKANGYKVIMLRFIIFLNLLYVPFNDAYFSTGLWIL